MSKKKTVLTYLTIIGITLVGAGLSSIFVNLGMDEYNTLIKPPLSPPNILFPIAWTLFYLIMSISFSYIYLNSDKNQRKAASKIYFLQLAVNLLWPLFFFTLGLYFFSYLWLTLLIVLVISMIIIFYDISKPAALVNLGYLAWLIFASYLNLGVFSLNI